MIKYVGGQRPESLGPVDRLKGWTYSHSAPIEVIVMVLSAAIALGLLAFLLWLGVLDAVNQSIGS